MTRIFETVRKKSLKDFPAAEAIVFKPFRAKFMQGA